MKKIVKKTRKNSPLYAALAVLLGVSLLQLFNLSHLANSNLLPTQNATAAADEKVICTKGDSYIPTRLTISKVGINLPIVPMALHNGTWAVMDGVANYALETSRVNPTSGNVGIYGHDKSDALQNIHNLKTGDLITVRTAGHIATYKVTGAAVVNPEDVNKFYPTKKPTLTLITCDGPFFLQRYVIQSSLVSIKVAQCAS